ncbi:transforming acidic coiled-coil-containing protein 3 isoform X2 [Orussus abietinus]|nr:transforming acidic coiled-coil-containing protein 3 isoform X2 [Orussus abietinus]
MAQRIVELEAKLSKEIEGRNHQMTLMKEYEKRTNEWLSERNKEIEILKSEKENREEECRSLQEHLEVISKHLGNLEISFNDVHEKYERAKSTIQVLQKNIGILKQSLTEHQECIRQKHNQFLELKEHAIERLNYANAQLDLIERKYSLEGSKLRAAVNEAEMNARSLSEQLDRRNQENAELSSICDGLLKRLNLPGKYPRKESLTDFIDESETISSPENQSYET